MCLGVACCPWSTWSWEEANKLRIITSIDSYMFLSVMSKVTSYIKLHHATEMQKTNPVPLSRLPMRRFKFRKLLSFLVLTKHVTLGAGGLTGTSLMPHFQTLWACKSLADLPPIIFLGRGVEGWRQVWLKATKDTQSRGVLFHLHIYSILHMSSWLVAVPLGTNSCRQRLDNSRWQQSAEIILSSYKMLQPYTLSAWISEPS